MKDESLDLINTRDLNVDFLSPIEEIKLLKQKEQAEGTWIMRIHKTTRRRVVKEE